MLQIIPRAIDFFTGKALEYENEDDFDEEDFDDEDEFDEDDVSPRFGLSLPSLTTTLLCYRTRMTMTVVLPLLRPLRRTLRSASSSKSRSFDTSFRFLAVFPALPPGCKISKAICGDDGLYLLFMIRGS